MQHQRRWENDAHFCIEQAIVMNLCFTGSRSGGTASPCCCAAPAAPGNRRSHRCWRRGWASRRSCPRTPFATCCAASPRKQRRHCCGCQLTRPATASGVRCMYQQYASRAFLRPSSNGNLACQRCSSAEGSSVGKGFQQITACCNPASHRLRLQCIAGVPTPARAAPQHPLRRPTRRKRSRCGSSLSALQHLAQTLPQATCRGTRHAACMEGRCALLGHVAAC